MGDDSPFAIDVDGRTVRGESLTELVAALIPGYSDAPAEALEQRYRAAVVRADDLQLSACLRAVEDGSLDLDELDESALTPLFASRSELPLVPGDVWELGVTLYLVATDYEPFTTRTKPVGNVAFVDPTNERTLLASLSDAGSLTLFVQEGAA
ncbi:hypothetical protein CHO01_39420 [Cellulomonas hominis]|uniref:Uncharacterized protein n=1 Tax=Cellulomonas hominis TaxID=156981 RepID=A0A511FHU8_9CELL|nr:hypothetical protein [Cellulomonas hominis]MBB5474640.1 hypothetical protein [Cellulomonas hominis]NKY06002.1 hypothetical protein [Cellulomonas hominis]GEL48826.1 hypothetical protein CHO01_39420 [Cellulomonas hominis]